MGRKKRGGSTHQQKQQQPKQLDPADFMFTKKTHQTLVKKPGTVNGNQFIIEDLEDCDVLVLDHCSTVTVDYLKRCHVVIGPTEDSVFIRNCEDCVFSIACRQFRARDCSNCEVYLYVATDPIIETSTGMRFAIWNVSYPYATEHFKAAKLDPLDNHYHRVFDFSADDDSIPMPHFTFLKPEEEEELREYPYPILGSNEEDSEEDVPPVEAAAVENPVPRIPSVLEGVVVPGSTSGMVPSGIRSFGFDTSQEQAEAVMQQGDFGEEHQPQQQQEEEYNYEDPYLAQEDEEQQQQQQHTTTSTSWEYTGAESFYAEPAYEDDELSAPAQQQQQVWDNNQPQQQPQHQQYTYGNNDKLSAKDAQERDAKQRTRQEAAEYLENFKQKRRQELEAKQKSNRAHQEELSLLIEDRLQSKGGSNPWKTVYSYLEGTPAFKHASTSAQKEQKQQDHKDLSRMKEVILHLVK